MSKYVIAYSEKNRELKDNFIYGNEVSLKEYEQIKKDKFIYDKHLNETIFVNKVKLLEIIKEDEVLG